MKRWSPQKKNTDSLNIKVTPNYNGRGHVKTVLVCYATRYGSTGKVASIIAEELIKADLEVTLSPLSLVEDPGTSDAVVIGSPLYMGKWLAEARNFVSRFRTKLQARPVAVFTVGYSYRDRMKEDIGNGDESLESIRLFISPVAEGYFAGRVDPDSMNSADRQVTRLAGMNPGDFMSPESVRNWARGLPHILFPPGKQ
jgi:menaquinone-dependent protoporphyrinogen oxidase